MTRRQHRKDKALRLQLKQQEEAVQNERPVWANDEKLEVQDNNWKETFMSEVKAAIALRSLVAA